MGTSRVGITGPVGERWALGQIGPEAKEAVPALIAALKDEY